MKRESLIICKWMLTQLMALFVQIAKGAVAAATFFQGCIKHVDDRLSLDREPPL